MSDREKCKRLVALLARYVKADDVGLAREIFLRRVIERITDELAAKCR